MELSIRQAEKKDLGPLLALERLCFASDLLSLRSFSRALSSSSSCLLVAAGQTSNQNHILGYLLLFFRKNSHKARLYSLALHPDARGKGAGKALLRRAEQEALKRGCRTIYLEVREDNATAIALYERAKYTVICKLARYYEDGGNGWRMSKDFLLCEQ